MYTVSLRYFLGFLSQNPNPKKKHKPSVQVKTYKMPDTTQYRHTKHTLAVTDSQLIRQELHPLEKNDPVYEQEAEKHEEEKKTDVLERIFSTAFATTKFFVVLRPMTGLSSLLGTTGFGDLTSLLVNLVAVVEMLDFSCEVFQNNGKKRNRETYVWISGTHHDFYSISRRIGDHSWSSPYRTFCDLPFVL